MFLESSDTVAAFGRYAATGKATGVRGDPPQFRDGKVVRYVNFVNTGAFVQAMKA